MSDTFILENKITEVFCDKLIDYYKSNIGRSNKVEEYGKVSNQIVLTNEDSIYNDYVKHLDVCIKKYLKKYEWCNNVQKFKTSSSIKIQYYKPNEGFWDWHMENNGIYPDIKRHLVFMTYLNNVENGGTDFLYQNYTTKAIKGNTVIWPAAWTHTHKGQISKTEDKYIITGWYVFNE